MSAYKFSNEVNVTSISQVAKALSINVETVRFYERKGLITQPLKPSVGYRHYPETTINRIRFIKRAQQLGFTLDEISSLLSLDDNSCQQAQALAEEKLTITKEKIADLKHLETALHDLLLQCHENDSDQHCPLIDSLLPK